MNVLVTSDDVSPYNDLEGSNPKDSFDELQNQEIISILIPQRELAFKLKKMNLLANFKVFTENSTISDHLKVSLGTLMPVLITSQEL